MLSVLAPLQRADARRDLFIVGGFLRDALLGCQRQDVDIDFCLARGSLRFARALARSLGAGFVVLDEDHATARVVLKRQGGLWTLDFCDFRDTDLQGDLKKRDFTIDALALPLAAVSSRPVARCALIDPCRGQDDLRAGRIRQVYARAFDDDPLRILRAYSLAARFGFSLDPGTERRLRLKRRLLSSVSAERIREELFKILKSPRAYETLARMDTQRLLGIFLPELEGMRGMDGGPYHHLDILKHSFETLRQLELLVAQQDRDVAVRTYLNEELGAGHSRRAVLKLAALLHDIGKPASRRRRGRKVIFHGHERLGAEMAETLCRRLRFSKDECRALRILIFCHLRPGYLGDHPTVSPRAAFRYFRDTAAEAASTLLLSLADQRSTKGRLTTRLSALQHEKICAQLLRAYFRKAQDPPPPRLVNGNDLMKALRLDPSPLVGALLADLAELQAIGKISSKKEALAAAGKRLPALRRSLALNTAKK